MSFCLFDLLNAHSQISLNKISILQVSASDLLSLNICHACISYLNSWQSFKNRCDAAQRKQKIWLATSSVEGGTKKVQNTGQSLLKNHLNGHGNQLKPAIANEHQKFQKKQAELQRKKLQELVRQQKGNNDIDTSFIKAEPVSDDVSAKKTRTLITILISHVYMRIG